MSVHITKTYNIGGLIGLRQNAVKNAGETLGFKEMSLFKFPDAYDSDDELHVRMDGIIASLCPEDIVIFQHPSGESPRYDGFLFEHLRRYHGTKIVAFIQEIAFDRDDSEYSLSDEITLLNRADMFIFASAALRDYYIANGLKEKPYLIQNIPDYMTDICANEHKNKKLYIMAETSQNEYPLNNLNIEVVQYDEYRAMESIYEFVNNVGDRHKHNCYLVMVTMNTLPEQLADIEKIEKALDCMEQSIRSKIRKVDVCTRYSSMQYLIILFEPQENQIPNVMERIFMHYYELCDREDFKPQYEYIKMTEPK